MSRVAILTAGLLALWAAANAASPVMPNFLGRWDYVGLNSFWVQVGDTNDDRIPDLIAGSYGTFNVMFGNGDGTFSPGPISQPGSNDT
jgi:hypothetical protein